MKRGIAYLRVSTELQDIERQKKLIEDYSKNNEIEVVKWIQEKVSGTKSDRIGLCELMQCDNTIADIVIVAEMSRFSRQNDLVQVAFNITTVLQNGLDLVFIDKPDKIYKAGQQLSMIDTIMVIVEAYSNAVERTKIVERLTTQKVIMLERNPYSYLYGEVNFGYKVVDNPDYDRKQIDGKVAKKIIVEDKEKADIVRKVFKMYIEGKTMYEITRWMNLNNYSYSYSFVKAMLSNKIYKGERIYNKKTFHIKPIIDAETFNKAQVLKEKNKKRAQNSQIEINPYKGLIFCGHCGRSLMQQRKDERKKWQRSVYICRGKNLLGQKFVDANKCKSRNIPKECLFEAMLLVFNDVTSFDPKKCFKPAVKILRKEIENKEVKHSAINKQIVKNEKEMERIANSLLDCNIDSLRNRYKQKYLDAEKSNIELNEQLAKLENEIAEIALKIEKINKPNNGRWVSEKDLTEQFTPHIERITIFTEGPKRFYIVMRTISGKEFTILSTFTQYESSSIKLSADYKLNTENLTCIRISDNKEFSFQELTDMQLKDNIFSCIKANKPVYMAD